MSPIPEDAKWLTVLNLKTPFLGSKPIPPHNCFDFYSGQIATIHMDSIVSGVSGQPTLDLPGPKDTTMGDTPKRKGCSTVYTQHINMHLTMGVSDQSTT